MTRPMYCVAIIWLLAAGALAQHPDADAAYADRDKYCQPADFDQVYYLTTRPWVGDEAKDLERAIRLVVTQTSRQPVIERCVPRRLGAGLMRIDLRNLKWRFEDWAHIMRTRYPYYDKGKLPLIVRADWLLAELSDMQVSDSYHRLLYGAEQPKTRDDVLKIFGVGKQPELTWGMIEGQSGVSEQGTRRLQSFPIPRGYAWGTQDVLKLDTARDPLENLEGTAPHDGEEWILGVPKMSITRGVRGVLQVYFLANGAGIIVPRAPVDLVEDKTEFRGHREIRFPGSCIQCHKIGLNLPTENALRKLTDQGVEVFADYETASELEANLLGDLKKEINRDNDDYQVIVELVSGCGSTQVAESFRAAIDRYDAPLDLLRTAEEAHLTVEQWTKTLAQNTNLPLRLASLPEGGEISRPAWEEYFVDSMYSAKDQRPITRKSVQQEK